MTDADIIELIQESLAEVAPTSDFSDLHMTTAIADLSLDSITTMEMVGFLEDRVDLTFPDEELAKVKTVADLAALVRGQNVGA